MTDVTARLDAIQDRIAWLQDLARNQQGQIDAHAAMFSPANIARIVKKTGLSIQTVNEVIRELRVDDA
jgi:hypothetical protein